MSDEPGPSDPIEAPQLAPAPAMPSSLPIVRFYRGAKDWLDFERITDAAAAKQKVSESVAEVLGARHISFLLGAGCSSLLREGLETGIPTMPELARECLAHCGHPLGAVPDGAGEERAALPPEPGAEAPPVTDSTAPAAEAATHDGLAHADAAFLRDTIGLDVATPPYSQNLERLLEVLYAQRFAWRATSPVHEEALKKLEKIIDKLARFLVARCLVDRLCAHDSPVLAVYRRFYRKLVYRDRSLPRPWVFTTNYDLLSETALDRLGIHQCNGFSGFVERHFDPASFRLALAEQLDVATRRWSTVDNFIYLCKLHGSVNWTQGDGPIDVREVQRPRVEEAGQMMIYPSPLKHHATLATPYSDLFREFQAQVVREQSVLVTLGYSFSDEHVNAIIYQALSIPTFRLVIFANPDAEGVARLRKLDDPRIWIIGGAATGSATRGHYFEHVVDNFLPELPGERIDKAVERVARLLRAVLGSSKSSAPGDPTLNDGGGQ